MDINENPAQVLTPVTGESFIKIARRIQQQSARKIAYNNGKPIEIDPDTEYSVVLLGMTELLDTDGFNALMPFIGEAIEKATVAGVLAPGQIKSIATAFSIPKQPPFPFDFPEGAGRKVFVDGTWTFRNEWVAPPVEVEIDEEATE
jgi:hypothetical protein